MTHDTLKRAALQRPEVRTEYDALAPEFEILRQMLKAQRS
jgi:hypothetical protein